MALVQGTGPYVSGAHGDHDHLGLPRADTGYRTPHQQHEPKPTGLDWAALAPVCKLCGQKSSTVNTRTGMCSTCAPVVKLKPPKPPKLPKEGKQGKPTTRSSAPRASTTSEVPDTPGRAPGAGPSTTREKNPAATQETRPVVAAGTLDTFQQLRDQLAAAVDALDTFLHTHTHTSIETSPQPEAAPEKPQAAGSTTTSEAVDTSRAVRTALATPVRTRRPTARGPRPEKITLDTAAIVAGYAAGKSLVQLGLEFGVSHPVIARHLDAAGVVRRNQRHAYTPEFLAQVRSLYVDEGLGQLEVAARLNVGLHVIQNAMRHGNIPARLSASKASQAGIGHVIKIPREEHQTIVDRYLAGESGPDIATSYDVAPASIYHILRARNIAIRTASQSRQEATG